MPENCNKCPPQLRCGGRVLDLQKPQIMAVINVTPDSFSDGGQFQDGAGVVSIDKLLERVEGACRGGATIIDIGGESTRPGAAPVSEQEECDRVLPAVEAVAQRFDVVISVDTSSAAVIRESAVLGAGMLNDVRALQRPGALLAAAESGLPVCLMHMQGEPDKMQNNPRYRNIVDEVTQFLLSRVAACTAAGIGKENILLDPGFGFGKSLDHNLELFRALSHFAELGFPLMVGLSRKSMLGSITHRDVSERMPASIVAAALAAERGAHIFRVHDVEETRDALSVAAAIVGRRE